MGKVLELELDLEDGRTEIVWHRNSWDRMATDKSEGRPNFGDVSQERGEIEMNYLPFGVESYNAGQLLHMNPVDNNARLN